MKKICYFIDSYYLYFYIFLLLPFLEPAALGISAVNVSFWYWKFVNCILLIIYFIAKRKFIFSKIVFSIIIFEMILLLSTLINGGNLIEALGNAAAIIFVSVLIEDSAFKIGIKKTLSIIVIIYLAFSVINFAEVLVKFDGTDANNHFLLGMDNRFIFCFLPMIVFSILIDTDNKHILPLITIVISLVTLLYTKSIGALIGLVLLILYYYFFVIKKKSVRYINFKNCFIIICILNALLLCLDFQYIFKEVIGVLGKEPTLNGRIYLWKKGINGFLSSPFIGNGIDTEFLKVCLYGYNHFHNLFLNILYQGGIFGFLAYLYINLVVGSKLMIYKKSNYSKIMFSAIIICLVLSLVDTLDYPFLFAFYVLGFHADILSYYDRKASDVGIVTFFNSTSYGGTLQSLATLKILESLGKSAEFINYTNVYEQRKIKGNSPKQIIRNFLVNIAFFEWYWKEKAFSRNLLLYDGKVSSKKYFNISDMKDIKNKILVVGSDQVWNARITGGLDNVFLLDFGNAKIKLSYSSSMGNYILSETDKLKFKKCFKTFNYISVRENYARSVLECTTGKRIALTCDPTILFSSKEWLKMLSKFDNRFKVRNNNYILTFFVGGSVEEYRDYIMYLKSMTNLPVYNIHKNKFKREGVDKSLAGVSVPEFVYLIKNSKYVMTDSFHGVVFSILFRKKIIPLSNKSNSIRVAELLKQLDLEYLLDNKNSYKEKIDYNKINNKINKIRKKSIDWLKKSLETDDEH